MTKPIFHPLAGRELMEGIDWHEGKVRGLGGQFLERVTQALEHIQGRWARRGPSGWSSSRSSRLENQCALLGIA